MKTYLSVDIDFWDGLAPGALRSDLERLVSSLKRRRVPITAVMNHQQLLPHVSNSKARELVNVDQHSDLGDPGTSLLECGTWVSYVPWRKEGKYTWIRRHSLHLGECNGDDPIFHKRGVNKKRSDWGDLAAERVKDHFPFREKLFSNIVEAGICLSPAWVDKDFEKVFRSTIQQYEIPYKWGRRAEHYMGVRRRPPGIDRSWCMPWKDS